MQFGFTLNDVEKLLNNYDYRVVNRMLLQASKMKLIDRLYLKIAIAEAVNAGYSSARSKKRANPFYKWQRKIIRQIDKLEGRLYKLPTVWDNFKRGKSRKLGK